MLNPSVHAVDRYRERFEPSLSSREAELRLRRISRSARWTRLQPGGAVLYTNGDISLIVAGRVIVTVYRELPDDVDFPRLFAA